MPAPGAPVVGPLEVVEILAALQFAITVVVATFDIIVVWFGVWIPLRRSVAPEDRPFLFTGIGAYAKASREEKEELEFLRQRERARQESVRGR